MQSIDLRQLQWQYPYPKPKAPAQLWLLASITVGGLIALFFAALTAFLLVASPIQAFFAALLIEAGLVIEALALIRWPKSIYPWLGLVISFVVSGTYNYTQAEKAGQSLGEWQLLTLAFGPLAALASVSLTLGNELRAYQERIADWERKRAEWVEGERNRLEEKAEKEKLRLERREEKFRQGTTEAEENRQVFGKSSDLPKWLPQVPNSLKEFKYLIDEGIIILPPGLTGADLQTHIPSVGTDRTGRNWLIGVGYRGMDTKEQTNGKH